MTPRQPVRVDDAFVVLDKPAGLLSVPGRGEAGRVNLWSIAQAQWPDVQVVHRLDMATSGLIVLARGDAAQRALSASFREREVDKRYVAVVHGLPCDDAGEVDLPLIADWPNRPRQKVDRVAGKPSLTRWRVLQRDTAQGRTRLELEPVTGRSHQLRVHLAAIGHAIVGDPLYGPPTPEAPRLLLHAQRLAFPHPRDRGRVDCRADVPF